MQQKDTNFKLELLQHVNVFCFPNPYWLSEIDWNNNSF